MTVFTDHSNVVNNIRWHPTYGHLLASSSLDHTARIWSVFDSPGEVASVEHSEGVKDVQWTCDGAKLLSGGLDKYVNVADLESGKIIHSYRHTEWISSLCPHPTNSNLFLSGATRRGIVCWDMRSSRVIREYFGRFGEVQDMAFLDVCFAPKFDVERRLQLRLDRRDPSEELAGPGHHRVGFQIGFCWVVCSTRELAYRIRCTLRAILARAFANTPAKTCSSHRALRDTSQRSDRRNRIAWMCER